jgi:penicillin-binding protein 1C
MARKARARVLDRAAAARLFPADEIAQARAEAVPTARLAMPILAPHAADTAIRAAPGRKIHRLTIDARLQSALEALARDRARALGADISVAILAVENATGEIRARIASADYLDAGRAGQVDMIEAPRSPGSTLKPFIYGLAVEDGLVHPETLIDDRPVRYGDYAPENFDLTFQGTVTVRKALQLSLNVPAVALLDAVGPARLAARLAQAGAPLLLPKNETPNLAMGLGGVGVRLADLTMLYAGLARLGGVMPLTISADSTSERLPRQLLDAVSAWHMANVLLGTPPPLNAPAGRIAFKTGTSYGYRDAWSIGFDGRLTIGVWVGRPDGAPVPGLIGRSAAAPILFEAFARSGRRPAPLPRAPRGTLVASSAKLPPPLQRFRHVAARDMSSPRILFPPDGARLELVRDRLGQAEPIAVKVHGGSEPLTVLVNGVPAVHEGSRTLLFKPDGPGFLRVTVIDAAGDADSITMRLQ